MNTTTTMDAPRYSRAWLLASVGLLLVAFGPALEELFHVWIERDEYSHGLLMPFVAAWLVWDRRDEWKALKPRPSWLGILMLVPCLAALLVGEMRVLVWLPPFAFVGALFSLAVAWYGTGIIKLAAPVVVVLLLMCPLPGRLQLALTRPLKHTASAMATGLLDVTGIPATLEGNIIKIPGIEDLWVAEACSGIRSFISLLSLSVLVCLLWQRPWYLKLLVIAAAAPIAIVINALRIWLTGYISFNAGPEAAEGVFHTFEGILLFVVGLALLLGWVATLGFVFPGRREDPA